MSGKSFFVKQLLKNVDQMCNIKFDKILFFYGEYQSSYDDNYGREIEFHEGLPSNEQLSRDIHLKKLIILDDLMRESSNDVICDLFTKGCHHRNLSVILISQNVFHQGKNQRTISINSNYLILFKNPRDRSQIFHLSRQIYPIDPKFLIEAYNDATTDPFGYILVDMKQSTPDNLRFRTKIFPLDGICYVYVPRKKI